MGNLYFSQCFTKLLFLFGGDNSQKEKNVITYLTTIIKM